jgi:hypothetical protein
MPRAAGATAQPSVDEGGPHSELRVQYFLRGLGALHGQRGLGDSGLRKRGRLRWIRVRGKGN